MTLDNTILQAFAGKLHGTLVRPGDADYDAARAVYNGMIDRRPALIVRCADVSDVVATVNLARQQGLPLAVRGGGHNGGGLGVCDEGVVLDLAGLKQIAVDPAAQSVRVGGGCLWREVDAATQAYGLAVPSGIIGSTGVGGLTLGGGIGHLARRHGLTVDNLMAAQVVLADGTSVRASADAHPDLFWALRGGGGNFGVVCEFEFRAHKVGTVVAGPTFWAPERTDEVMRWYRDFIAAAPRELNGFFSLGKVPPVAPFPEALHGQTVCGVVWCWTGAPEAADAVFEPVRSFGPPLMHGVQPMPYAALQGAFDALYPPGLQWYWRADFVGELSNAAVAQHAEFARDWPTLHSTMHLYPIDGQVHDVDAADTAFAYRDVRWAQVIVGVSPDPAEAAQVTAWTKRYWEALHPYAAAGAYVNFLMDEGDDRVRASYRGNYERLAIIKGRYDPDNLFRINQNIQPASKPALQR